MRLSILIPTLVDRLLHQKKFLYNIISELQKQTKHFSDIEILSLLDNRKLSTGVKRNILLQQAQGDYVAFVDDDDMISENYIKEILVGLESGCDVITFLVEANVKSELLESQGFVHNRVVKCNYDLSKETPTKVEKWNRENIRKFPTLEENWTGKPAHIMVWKSRVAKQCYFPDKTLGEDFDWVDDVCKLAKTQYNINKVLYYYNAVCDKGY